MGIYVFNAAYLYSELLRDIDAWLERRNSQALSRPKASQKAALVSQEATLNWVSNASGARLSCTSGCGAPITWGMTSSTAPSAFSSQWRALEDWVGFA